MSKTEEKGTQNLDDFTLLIGDALKVLRTMPDESVHCVVTSPPYWGLRDYGTGTWEGGDSECDHAVRPNLKIESSTLGGGKASTGHQLEGYGSACGRCGARRVDFQLGLEPTPEKYVARMVEVFSEVWRVLRKDGTCWLNIGDSYNNRNVSRKSSHQGGLGFKSADLSKSWARLKQEGRTRLSLTEDGLKEKDLCGIPWRLAFALQSAGWYLRSDIIWAKPNPMPESVRDRPTKSHEYLFLLTKSSRYVYDADAIREPAKWERWGDQTNRKYEGSKTTSGWIGDTSKAELQARSTPTSNDLGDPAKGRNARSVWSFATQPYPKAHFATFPEELPRRCIAAGTSERGCCPECGAPWLRETETSRTFESGSGRSGRDPIGKNGPNLQGGGETRDIWNGPVVSVRTTGWRPTCEHEQEPVPCVVLDPFLGSGTTAQVALSLGRRAIGIELSPEYEQLARERVATPPKKKKNNAT